MPCQRTTLAARAVGPLELLGRPCPHLRFDALGHLSHHGQAHRDVEPVDQVLGLGIEVARQLGVSGVTVKVAKNRTTNGG